MRELPGKGSELSKLYRDDSEIALHEGLWVLSGMG